MTGTPYGTRSVSGPLSSVVATWVSMPCRDNALARSRTIALGPPRKGPTDGITCRILFTDIQLATFLAWTKTESLIRVNGGNRRATHVRMQDAITTGLYFHGSRSMSSSRTPMPQKQSD